MNLLRQLHAWAGLVVSLFIAVLALSGSLLVFKAEWLKLTVPGAAEAVAPEPALLARGMQAAEAAFGRDQLRSVMFASPEFGLHLVYLKDEGGAYLDPHTGEVVQRWAKNERFVDWLFDLHHHLLAGETGTTISGVIGFAAALLVITGVIVWWPAARSFRWRVAPQTLTKRAHLLSAHRDLGILATPVALVLLLTGASVALHDVVQPVFDRVLGEGRKPETPTVAAAEAVAWPAALAAAQARFPDADLRLAAWPKGEGAPVSVRLRQPGEWHANGRTIATLDPGTGRLVSAHDAMTDGGGPRAYNALWPVHASRVGGLAWKTAAFLGGLALTALSLFGAEAFRRKLMKPRPKPKRVAQAV